MQINNNNQTSFGMKSISTYGLSSRMKKLVDGTRPKILEYGHPAAQCGINRDFGFWGFLGKVSVGVTFGDPASYTLGRTTTGWVFKPRGLMKLVARAHAGASENVVMAKLPSELPKGYFNPPIEDAHAVGNEQIRYIINKNPQAIETPTPIVPGDKTN